MDEMTVELVDRYSPRLPTVAWSMLGEYIQARKSLFDDMELVAAEQPFAVPLYPDAEKAWYIGRLDKVFKVTGDLIIGEHKSTADYKKDGGFKQQYLDQWSPNSQIDGYLYGGTMSYPDENLREVWVDAALVHKSVHNQFKFIPISRATSGLDHWLTETREWVRRILDSEFTLDGEGLDVAFPRNTNQCIGRYGRCSMYDICRTTPDPSQLTEPPAGYLEDRWVPFDVLGLDKLEKPK